MFNPIPILRWMGERRLSLTDMEKRTGISRCTLHNVLNSGKSPSWETFVILHRTTGIDPKEFIQPDQAPAA
jgi:transcriptional regulator with XRE-family HTH domain